MGTIKVDSIRIGGVDFQLIEGVLIKSDEPHIIAYGLAHPDKKVSFFEGKTARYYLEIPEQSTVLQGDLEILQTPDGIEERYLPGRTPAVPLRRPYIFILLSMNE